MTSPKDAANHLAEEYGVELPAHVTDSGNAKRLAKRYGGVFRYCYSFGKFLTWTGVRWANDEGGQLQAWAKETAISIYQESADLSQQAAELAQGGDKDGADKTEEAATAMWKWAKQSEAAPRIAAMLDLVRSEPGIAVLAPMLDRNPWLLNTLAGTADLKTGKTKPHDPGDLITMLAPVAYDPKAAFQPWDKFIEEAIPDEETRAYVQRCVGATLTGKADEDVLLICHGPGGAGKGTFLNAIRHTLGDYAAVADLETFTTKRDAGSPQPDVARLRGRRMVAISEVDTGGAVSLLKKATGGDPIVTRSHHQESFEFVPQFTMWIICNDRPRVPDNDTGMWRRIREIPFNTIFTNPDVNLRPMLSNPKVAGPAILAWAVAGCLKWQTNGTGHLPAAVLAATAEYRLDMDPLADWREDNTGLQEQGWTAVKVLYQDYADWCKDNHRRPIGSKTFSQRLSRHFDALNRGRYGGRGFTKLVLQIGVNTSELLPLSDVPVNSLEDFSHGEKPPVSSVDMFTAETTQIETPSVYSDSDEVLPSVDPSVTQEQTHSEQERTDDDLWGKE